MTKSKTMRFIANARLKDIVGRGLINDDNIAIIELIKNSKDAGSKCVSIDFYESDAEDGTSQIYITDHGSGMSIDDLEYKWLNIAYSEKKTSAPKVGAYAGSKGIGRFSCDRLGRHLNIYTRPKGGQYVTLALDWEQFEVDDRDTQIGHIETEARTISVAEFRSETGVDDFGQGTLLIIQDLRASWTLERLRSLRRELERFSIDPNQSFEVSLSHWKYADDHEINQPIRNKVFDDLDFRTTSISATIDERGEEIHIELRHDGDFVFRSVELNPYDALKALSAKIYFLNQPAKAFFKRRTGYHSVQYGSVFLFLNGFRVFPYGSEGDDWLGLDRRRQQGQRRFFGTRDLVGYIEVTDADDRFEQVSSREGLVGNVAYNQLTSSTATVSSSIDDANLYGLVHKITRKLEQFVVEGLDWDRISRASTIDDEDLLSGNFEYLKTEKPVLETIDSIVSIRSPAKHMKEVEINLEYLSELADQEAEEYDELVQNLEQKFDGTPIEKLKPSEKRDLSKFISRSAKELANKDRTNADLEKQKAKTERALKVETKKRLFAEYENSTDNERILQLHHQVNLIAGAIWKRLDSVTRRFRKDPERYTKEELVEVIEGGLYELGRIRNVAKLALKADFDLMTNRVNEDLVQFIEEYLENFKDIHYALSLKVVFSNPDNVELKRSFRPIEVTILVDNILVNAGKAGANRVRVNVYKAEKEVVLEFVDNGKGLTSKFDPEDLFSKGITTTSGSGIGLSHVKQIVESMKGDITINSGKKSGAVLKVKFR